jgi:tetratricopeptide (TPR) repeat protein
MTPNNPASGNPAAPPLSDLFARYLQRQAAAAAAGFGSVAATGEVVPFEAAPAQPVDARLAWQEALAAVHALCPGVETRSWKAPADWPALVAAHEPALALTFSLGNFPQLVRDLHPLLHGTELTALRPGVGRPLAAVTLLDWADRVQAKKDAGQVLLAAGCLRLARQFEAADALLHTDFPTEWRNAAANEQAALAWHRGRAEQAAALWQTQRESTPVLFNRGMAALFLDQPAAARPWLSQAVDQLPDSSAWHHLGRLYLALAEMRLGAGKG